MNDLGIGEQDGIDASLVRYYLNTYLGIARESEVVTCACFVSSRN